MNYKNVQKVNSYKMSQWIGTMQFETFVTVNWKDNIVLTIRCGDKYKKQDHMSAKHFSQFFWKGVIVCEVVFTTTNIEMTLVAAYIAMTVLALLWIQIF